jgi:molybdopterin converting factor subunit 1
MDTGKGLDEQTRSVTVRVVYFASLREARGCSEERLSTAARSAAGLYDELCARHPFRLGRDALRVAVNECFVDWDTELRQNDEVVFIPPVAGG